MLLQQKEREVQKHLKMTKFNSFVKIVTFIFAFNWSHLNSYYLKLSCASLSSLKPAFWIIILIELISSTLPGSFF